MALTRYEIDAIANDADSLRESLTALGFERAEAVRLVAAAMPAIVTADYEPEET